MREKFDESGRRGVCQKGRRAIEKFCERLNSIVDCVVS
jgi:hypothetical protein